MHSSNLALLFHDFPMFARTQTWFQQPETGIRYFRLYVSPQKKHLKGGNQKLEVPSSIETIIFQGVMVSMLFFCAV